jgi:AcrR family transcriptional regulator
VPRAAHPPKALKAKPAKAPPKRSATKTPAAKPPAKPSHRRLGRATYHHGDLRRALVDAAATIIADRGAEAFTLREAARRLGVNHRAAYRHFADKTSLLAAVAEQGFAALVEGARAEIAAANATDPEGRLLAMARAYVAWADRHPAHFRVMFGPRLNEDGGAFEATMAEAYGLLESEIRAAIGAGTTLAGPGDDAVTDVVIAYWAVLHGLASLVLMKRVRVRRDQLPAWIDRIVGKAVRAMRRT